MIATNQHPMIAATVPEATFRTRLSLSKRARVRQIQFCSRWLCIISAIPEFAALIGAMRNLPGLRHVLEAMTGYNRPFTTLKEAEAFVSEYENGALGGLTSKFRNCDGVWRVEALGQHKKLRRGFLNDWFRVRWLEP